MTHIFRHPSRSDLIGLLIIIVCSPIFALIHNLQSKELFGSIPAALLASFPLGFLFVFPYTLFLITKYSTIGARSLRKPASI